MSWTGAIVEGLAFERALGEEEFARAWRRAERFARDRGCARPRGLSVPADEGDDWLPFAAFFRRACQAEWEGRVHADYNGLRLLLQRHDEPAALGTERVTLLA